MVASHEGRFPERKLCDRSELFRADFGRITEDSVSFGFVLSRSSGQPFLQWTNRSMRHYFLAVSNMLVYTLLESSLVCVCVILSWNCLLVEGRARVCCFFYALPLLLELDIQ